MKPGDLVRTQATHGHENLWREVSHPLGAKFFAVPHTDIMILVEGPWSGSGRRREEYVRVLHPVHGLIRGLVESLEVIDETG